MSDVGKGPIWLGAEMSSVLLLVHFEENGCNKKKVTHLNLPEVPF